MPSLNASSARSTRAVKYSSRATQLRSHLVGVVIVADLERVRLDQELNAIERAYAIQTSGITPTDIDDGPAIVLALASPEIELLGCTTCGGN